MRRKFYCFGFTFDSNKLTTFPAGLYLATTYTLVLSLVFAFAIPISLLALQTNCKGKVTVKYLSHYQDNHISPLKRPPVSIVVYQLGHAVKLCSGWLAWVTLLRNKFTIGFCFTPNNNFFWFMFGRPGRSIIS